MATERAKIRTQVGKPDVLLNFDGPGTVAVRVDDAGTVLITVKRQNPEAELPDIVELEGGGE